MVNRARRVAMDVAPLLGRRTGVGAFVEALLAELTALDRFDMTAYALTLRGSRNVPHMVAPSVRSVTHPMPAGPLTRLWARVPYPKIERWTGAVDVVHGTNFVVPPARQAATLVTVHDLAAVRHPELCTASSLRYPKLISRATERGSHVQVPSQFVADEVVGFLRIAESRVHVINHGISPLVGDGSVVVGGRAVKNDVQRGDGFSRYVLSVGTVEPRKGYPDLVRAFDLLAGQRPDVGLVVAGAPGWDGGAFMQAVDAARHKDRIRWLGWVSEADRAALIRGATVLAFPSIYEGFGLPPLEAMSAGVAVVATRAGAVPEVVGGAALLVDVGDYAGLAEKLSLVLDNDDEARRLIEAGYERVKAFSWQRCAQEFAALYDELIRENA